MSFTTFWSPNQASVAQQETYTFVTPLGAGNTYVATINNKSVTYVATAADVTSATNASVATGLFNLLNASPSLLPELSEITFANPSAGVVTATAKASGVPFANVPGTSAGLVLSTGNGLSNGIATVHTQANQSPSDINDPQNWLRVNLTPTPPAKTRALPANGDDVVVNNTSVPLLWNLDQLASVQFNTYTRWQNFTGTIGLPENNTNGYAEWRATYFKFAGPQGSVPAGGLSMILGYGTTGQGPSRERYDVGSQPVTLNVLAAGQAADEWGVRFLGQHTANTFNLLGGVSLGIGMIPGEKANISTSFVDGGGSLGIGSNVTWTANSTLTMMGGSVVLNAAPATLLLNNGAQATFLTDALTWPTITAQQGSLMTWLAGGIITTLTMTTNCNLDKSQDARTLTITNATLDGDTCQINDPLNAIVYTNAVTVKQQVTSGPFLFTGSRTVKVV